MEPIYLMTRLLINLKLSRRLCWSKFLMKHILGSRRSVMIVIDFLFSPDDIPILFIIIGGGTKVIIDGIISHL
jgi:hypothetical protein